MIYAEASCHILNFYGLKMLHWSSGMILTLLRKRNMKSVIYGLVIMLFFSNILAYNFEKRMSELSENV